MVMRCNLAPVFMSAPFGPFEICNHYKGSQGFKCASASRTAESCSMVQD